MRYTFLLTNIMNIIDDMKLAQVTVYANCRDTKGVTMSLHHCLYFCTTEMVKDATHRCRQISDKEERSAFKRTLISATFSGSFPEGRQADKMQKHSGYICIDIDGIKTQDFDEVFYNLQRTDICAYVSRSIGGNGIFALIKLAFPDRHKEQFEALQEYFNNLPLFKRKGLTLDKSCSDVSRLRILAYDPEAYISTNAVPFTALPAPKQAKRTAGRQPEYTDDDTLKAVDNCVKQIEARHIDLTNAYDDWRTLAMSLASLGETGRDFFHRVSAVSHKYNPDECDAKFNSCRSSRITIGTFLGICKDNGITYKQQS